MDDPDTATPVVLHHLLVAHDRYFLNIPKYVHHFRPKEHFKHHLPTQGFDWGPWAEFSNWKNEWYHHFAKDDAKADNFAWHSVTMSLANAWSKRTALSLHTREHIDAGKTQVLDRAPPLSSATCLSRRSRPRVIR